jgi:hypothetical protein
MRELNELLERCSFTNDDVLVHVGDMIDRGPDSWKVADFFRSTGNAFTVVGNHEICVAGAIRGTALPACSQLLNRFAGTLAVCLVCQECRDVRSLAVVLKRKGTLSDAKRKLDEVLDTTS